MRFLLVSLGACVLTAAAQMRGWLWQNPLPQGNALNTIRFAEDGQRGWAVGADGVILRTDNGGFTWEQQTSPAVATLYGLFVEDRERAVVVGARGVVLRTDDGGREW